MSHATNVESLTSLRNSVDFWNDPKNDEKIRPLIERVKSRDRTLHPSDPETGWVPDLSQKYLLLSYVKENPDLGPDFAEVVRSDPKTWDDEWVDSLIHELSEPAI